jgi:hypothetical protein
LFAFREISRLPYFLPYCLLNLRPLAVVVTVHLAAEWQPAQVL